MVSLAGLLDRLVKNSVAKGFFGMQAHDQYLVRRQRLVQERCAGTITGKCLYKWYQRYY